MTSHSHVPDGWPALIPRLTTDDPRALVQFVQGVFGATGEFHAERPTELRIGDSMVMVSGSEERGSMTGFLYVYVPDADHCHQLAVDRGASSIEAPRDLPYGDRRAMVRDPWGNTWQIATHGGRFTP